ncbi:hypothetical protein HYPSUDRAFT_201617 [Hypholoma sublateritium FD-334 SS-4]|uniref:Uncharacterized protein n=1 Tax=Hypholoma sublateritium (strain FD-334 SS-4) TaxID=945553 RepID=A0A0D2PTR1_HYPSF|nr:hypothetical protein HYPSUDRAFT_201617 [Hypholoma sublateritium FD-334 SS-4]
MENEDSNLKFKEDAVDRQRQAQRTTAAARWREQAHSHDILATAPLSTSLSTPRPSFDAVTFWLRCISTNNSRGMTYTPSPLNSAITLKNDVQIAPPRSPTRVCRLPHIQQRPHSIPTNVPARASHVPHALFFNIAPALLPHDACAAADARRGADRSSTPPAQGLCSRSRSRRFSCKLSMGCRSASKYLPVILVPPFRVPVSLDWSSVSRDTRPAAVPPRFTPLDSVNAASAPAIAAPAGTISLLSGPPSRRSITHRRRNGIFASSNTLVDAVLDRPSHLAHKIATIAPVRAATLSLAPFLAPRPPPASNDALPAAPVDAIPNPALRQPATTLCRPHEP